MHDARTNKTLLRISTVARFITERIKKLKQGVNSLSGMENDEFAEQLGIPLFEEDEQQEAEKQQEKRFEGRSTCLR